MRERETKHGGTHFEIYCRCTNLLWCCICLLFFFIRLFYFLLGFVSMLVALSVFLLSPYLRAEKKWKRMSAVCLAPLGGRDVHNSKYTWILREWKHTEKYIVCNIPLWHLAVFALLDMFILKSVYCAISAFGWWRATERQYLFIAFYEARGYTHTYTHNWTLITYIFI